jgi:hypothetical protein
MMLPHSLAADAAQQSIHSSSNVLAAGKSKRASLPRQKPALKPPRWHPFAGCRQTHSRQRTARHRYSVVNPPPYPTPASPHPLPREPLPRHQQSSRHHAPLATRDAVCLFSSRKLQSTDEGIWPKDSTHLGQPRSLTWPNLVQVLTQYGPCPGPQPSGAAVHVCPCVYYVSPAWALVCVCARRGAAAGASGPRTHPCAVACMASSARPADPLQRDAQASAPAAYLSTPASIPAHTLASTGLQHPAPAGSKANTMHELVPCPP